MFALISKYVKPMEIIDELLEEHRAYLDRYYRTGHFICSGRQEPRVGGVILCKGGDRAEVEAIIAEDPFAIAGAAEYEIIEMIPTKYADGLENFIL